MEKAKKAYLTPMPAGLCLLKKTPQLIAEQKLLGSVASGFTTHWGYI
jgi:hypothetical protein